MPDPPVHFRFQNCAPFHFYTHNSFPSLPDDHSFGIQKTAFLIAGLLVDTTCCYYRLHVCFDSYHSTQNFVCDIKKTSLESIYCCIRCFRIFEKCLSKTGTCTTDFSFCFSKRYCGMFFKCFCNLRENIL